MLHKIKYAICKKYKWRIYIVFMVEHRGLEPLTPTLPV